MPDNSRKRCYVIMPFSVKEVDLPRYLDDPNHWQEVYRGLIEPAIVAAGLGCERDDEDYSSRMIFDHIWRKIEEADLILCDLSASNPNVLLELGWALRSDKRFVLIKDEMTPFHFDLHQFFTYTYSSKLRPSALRSSVSELTSVINQTLADESMGYSIVRKLSLSKSVIEATRTGNLELSMLKEIMEELRIIKMGREVSAPLAPAARTRGVNAHIYWHAQGLTFEAATALKEKLERASVATSLSEHRDPRSPDAMFIGAMVGAKEARLAITNAPYEIRYLFRADYPEIEGGDPQGLKIGIGYMSSHNKANRGTTSEPVAVTSHQIAELSDERLSNTEFQMKLRQWTFG